MRSSEERLHAETLKMWACIARGSEPVPCSSAEGRIVDCLACLHNSSPNSTRSFDMDSL